GLLEVVTADNLLGDARVDVDAGAGRIERRGAEIAQALGASADEEDAAFDLLRRHLACEDAPRGNATLRDRPDVVQPDSAVAIGRNVKGGDLLLARAGGGRRDAQRVHAPLAVRGLSARARGAEDVAPTVHGDSQRLDGERGNQQPWRIGAL